MSKIKYILVVFVAFLIFAGTFVLEKTVFGSSENVSQNEVYIVVPQGEEIQIGTRNVSGPTEVIFLNGDQLNSLNSNKVYVRFFENGIVRLDKNTNLQLNFYNKDEIYLSLLGGQVWANNLSTSAKLNLHAGFAYMVSQNASFNAIFDSADTTVYANKNSVLIGLVPADYSYGGEFINNYLLLQDNQTTVFGSKVKDNNDLLKKLLYSKLVKEFRYGTVDSEKVKENIWIQFNLNEDEKELGKISANESTEIQERGLQISSFDTFNFKFKQGFDKLAKILTFSKEKATSTQLDNLFVYFYDSEYLTTFGRNEEAKKYLQLFEQNAADYFQNEKFVERLWHEYALLSFISPTDNLYYLKSRLADLLFENFKQDPEKQFLITRELLNVAYNFGEKDPSLAKASFEKYYEKVLNLIVTSDKILLAEFLEQENHLMNNLFKKHPYLYEDKFFAMKNKLEEEWIVLISDAEDKNEGRLALLSSKIDFLKQLQRFFFEDKIGIDEARKIVFRLFREADNLELAADSKLAAEEFFEKNLNEFEIFFKYLSSSEYNSSDLHGASREEQFENFLKASEGVEIPEVLSGQKDSVKPKVKIRR